MAEAGMRGEGRTRSGPLTVGVASALASILLAGCAAPKPDLWPPSSEAAVHTVYVSVDTWHATIAFRTHQPATGDRPSPFGSNEGSPTTDHGGAGGPLFEEWGYAERGWYVEDRRGLTGILRALLWPTEGVVEIGRYDRVWAHRTPQPPADLFTFHLSEDGYRRLRTYLWSSLSTDKAVASFGESTFYLAVRDYHLFHTCHQYAAGGLREAGLPMSPFWAFNRSSLVRQLRRATRMMAE